ncbi:MAG: cyclase family protein [Bacillota bacterium]|nr:cyclase family protein [Bacillota bacterium]
MDKRYYDISVSLGKEAITYPGDPSFMRNELGALEEGDRFAVSLLAMSAHCGTHLDAPRHMFLEGKSIDRYQPEELIFTAKVVEIEAGDSVQEKDLQALNLQPDEAVLLKTLNSKNGGTRSGQFDEDYIYISEGAAQLCADKQLALVGIDAISVDSYQKGTDFPAHRILLGQGILILEGITLDRVEPGTYTLMCLPLKIDGGEAAPCRAILQQDT